ncbi:MAG: MalT-like region [Thermoanaerobaculia bacterium]|jgi:tetratricopeptide (TPR) repeat protein|nr:MalT-like region [Thermoanaerobaculia bacterium]
MTDAAREKARMFAAWLDTLDASAELVALSLADAGDVEWQEILSLLTEPLDTAAVSRTIARAHGLLGRSPRDAQSLARLALRMTRHLGPVCRDLPLIEGDAWRECAAAHLEMAEYADAYEAVAPARACYARSKSSRLNAAVLSLIEGRTLFELGRSAEALAAVDHGSSELLQCKADPKKYVQARTIYAGILLGIGRYNDALDVFTAAGDLARQAGDRETLAYTLWNVGLCAAQLDDFGRAKRCFSSALEYFDRLGLRSEMPHVRAALVTILRHQGRHKEAVSELFKIRAEFLSLQIPVAAAIASLRIVDVLLLSGRITDVPALCEEMVKTFTAARLQKNLLRALAHLSQIARQRQVATTDVTYVATFIELAQDDPHRSFPVPLESDQG